MAFDAMQRLSFNLMNILWYAVPMVSWLCVLSNGIAQQSGVQKKPQDSSWIKDQDSVHSFVIDNWQSSDGLLRNDIRAIVQTRDGYLWVASSAGVSRFDGIQFTHFTPANTPNMARHTIQCLHEDSKGRLWIGTAEGDLVYYRQGKFTKVAKPSSGEINCIAEGGDGRIWVGAGNGLCYVEGEQVRTLEQEDIQVSLPVRRLQYDPVLETLWFDQDGHLGYVANQTVGMALSADSQPLVYVNTILIAPSGGLEIITEQRTLLHAQSLQRISVPEALPVPPEEWASCGLIDQEGYLWIGMTESGLYRVLDKGSYSHLTMADGLRDNAISALCQDREGSIWVGTRSGGLHRLRKRVVQVIGATGGLVDESTNVVTPYVGGEGVFAATQSRKTFHVSDGRAVLLDLPSADVVFHDAQETLWINQLAILFAAYSVSSNGMVEQLVHSSKVLGRSTAIMQDHQGTVWFGGHFGLGCYKDDQFQEVDSIRQRATGFKSSVSCLADSKGDKRWVGTQGDGVFVLNVEDLTIRRFAEIPDEEFIRSVFEDSRGTLWVGTYGRGIWRIDSRSTQRFTGKDGLPNDYITGIVEDDYGDIWFGTHRGIVRVRSGQGDPVKESHADDVWFTSFGRSDGLSGEECVGDWHPNVCRTQDGRIWFATVKGVAVIDPKEVVQPLAVPSVVVETLHTEDGQELFPDRNKEPVSFLGLPKGAKRFDIRYTALSFVSSAQCQFQYQLEGFDRGWSRPSTSRVAYYANVPPGNYTFRVRASNHEGRWNPEGDAVRVILPPFFWETAWFRWGGMLMGLGLLVGIVRYASTQALKRKLLKEEQERLLEHERTRIARDMHDRLGSQLTRISLLTELASKAEGRQASAGDPLNRISEATRDLMSRMDQVVWAVNPLKDSAAELIGYCTDYAEQFLETSSMACRVSIPTDPPSIHVSSNTRYQFLLVLSEALNNVVRHAGASEVQLEWLLDGKSLELHIRDNGVGFDQESSDIDPSGLDNMRHRMASIGGRFLLTSEPGKGTLVRLSIERSAIQ